MKTEKAIERIKAFRDYLCAGNPIWDVDECKEAFDIAIAAMEQRLIPSADVPDINDGDLISRQAAIDEIEERKYANGYRNVAVISELNRLEGYIMRLPSAQPEQEDYTEMKRAFIRMAEYVDLFLVCDSGQKETLIGFISRLAEFMPWKGEEDE